MDKAPHSEKVPESMQSIFHSIVHLTDPFAQQHLNDAYAQLIRYATASMCRQNPVLMTRGQANGWACGITHAIGTVNGLFAPGEQLHMEEAKLFKAFGVTRRNGVAKSKTVLDTLDMTPFDPEWRLPSKAQGTPLTWKTLLERAKAGGRKRSRAGQELADRHEAMPSIPDKDGTRAATTKGNRGRTARTVTRSQQRCGLCGGTGPLTTTECCEQWICDDAHTYRLFSYARNSCYRNHDRYTLCSYHYHEDHPGRWQACNACKAGFETEMYVHRGTNEYNFEVLKNPPKYKPTTCTTCGRRIVLGDGGYSMGPEGYRCITCTEKKLGKLF